MVVRTNLAALLDTGTPARAVETVAVGLADVQYIVRGGGAGDVGVTDRRAVHACELVIKSRAGSRQSFKVGGHQLMHPISSRLNLRGVILRAAGLGASGLASSQSGRWLVHNNTSTIAVRQR